MNMGGEWIHGKSHRTYKVLGTCFQEKDLEPQIIYKLHRDETGRLVQDGGVFCRPLREWQQTVDNADTPRFFPKTDKAADS
jgi:hypothetical protein